MSDRYKGAILSGTAPTVTLQSAGGEYTLSQQMQYQGQGVWPTATQNPILKSLRFQASAAAYMNRTPASSSNRKTWTFSFWCKRGKLGTYQTPLWATTTGGTYDGTFVWLFDGDNFGLVDYHSGYGAFVSTNAVYRDPSAWYHFICAVDTTQATASNRVKLYVNGELITSLGTATYPSQNYDFDINANVAHNIGRDAPAIGARNYFDGEFAEVNFIDGVQLTPSSFGTTDVNGIWQPIPYTGAYGTNGYYLPFTNITSTTTLGYDFSGNGNNWTTNNFFLTPGRTYDSMYDSPSNASATVANYATWNPLLFYSTTAPTIVNGNLTAAWNNTSMFCGSTMTCPNNGKTYAEFTLTVANTTRIGIKDITNQAQYDGGWTYVANLGVIRNTTDTSVQPDLATASNNDVIGITVDLVNNSLQFYKNNSALGTPITIANSSNWAFWVGQNGSGSSIQVDANFGQQPFVYTPPTGFNRLNTYNLPVPTIPAGNKNMNVVLWTGNATYPRSITGVNFQPDFVWAKSRGIAYYHQTYDSVRGTGTGGGVLYPNTTDAVDDTYKLNSFDSDGFSFGSSLSALNTNNDPVVAWNWKAGNGVTSSNTNGSITSTVSANPTAGFSVVTFTAGSGASPSYITVGHGLGVAPAMVINKRRNGTSGWLVYHSALSTPATQWMELNNTSAVQTASPFWGASGMTSTTLGFSDNVVVNGQTYVNYCFAPVAGFSAFGKYTGNGSADGPFVYTGFRPRFLITKRTDGTSNWEIHDTSRDPYNLATNQLVANSSGAESTTYFIGDILSNGFKIRSTDNDYNTNGGTYIYMAFAENPFKMARAR